MTLSDDLNATADEIERRGWCQNSLSNNDGNVCMVGAMRSAELGLAGRMKARKAMCNFLGISYDSTSDSLPNWNDLPSRTQEEVVQALRDAAIKNQPDSMWG